MKALVYIAPGKLQVRQIPDPEPGPGQVLLQVRAAGICGVDLHTFRGHNSSVQPPAILGHEVVGTVVSVSHGSREICAGDRVVVDPLQSCEVCAECRRGRRNLCQQLRLLGADGGPGAFAEFVCVDSASVLPCPPQLSDCSAVGCEPLANTLHLLDIAKPHSEERILILGAGIQGTLFLQLVRSRGCRSVAVVDRAPARLEIARGAGAELAAVASGANLAEEIRKWSRYRGVDLVVDAAGAEDLRHLAVQVLRPGGRLILLGLKQPSGLLEFGRVVRNELDLRGSFGYTPQDFARALETLARGTASLERWTRCMPLDEGQRAFEAMEDPESVLKIALVPGAE